jgi:hypothetical protein
MVAFAPGKRPADHVERLRVSFERMFADRLDVAAPEAKASYVKPGADRRRGLLGSALLLTQAMARGIYGQAKTAMENLGVVDSLELYQGRGEPANAYAVLARRPIGILFVGDFASMFQGQELSGLIGHEIGHALCHLAHPDFAWARAAATHASYTDRARGFLLASELTADRFALLACRSLGVALKLQMRGVAGTARDVELDPKGYLTQCRSLADVALSSRAPMLGTTHPEHLLRAYATWLFWESDLHHELTGKGPSKRTMQEVDATLLRLIDPRSAMSSAKPKPSLLAPAPAHPRPPSTAPSGMNRPPLTPSKRRRLKR